MPFPLPLDDFTIRRLDALGPMFRGWCWVGGAFAVDMQHGEDVERFTGTTLHKAIGAAMKGRR